MNIQMLVDLPDDEFEQCVSQAIKGRRDFPDWWRLLLHEDLIDATEGVIEGFLEVGLRQARDPERYPHARGSRRRCAASSPRSRSNALSERRADE